MNRLEEVELLFQAVFFWNAFNIWPWEDCVRLLSICQVVHFEGLCRMACQDSMGEEVRFSWALLCAGLTLPWRKC